MTDSKNTIGRRAMRRKNTVGIITFLCLLAYTVFLFTPFYTIIVSSFTQNSEIMQTREFIWIPSKISLEGFEKIFSVSSTDGSSLFLSGFFNTMWQTLIPLVIGLFVSGFAAYCYSKLTFPFKEKLFLVEIATMTMPLGAFGIISYLFYSWLGWESSALPIIIPGMFGSATMIFFLRTYFDGISDEILEAAKMDGSGVFRNFFTLIAPIALPAFIAQFIFGFVSGYNNYASALMYLSAEKELWPLQLVLSNVVSDPQISPYFNAKCAAALVGMLPLVILFCFMQDGVTHEGTRNVITDGGKIPYDTLSLEKRVTKNSVPAFIWHTMEDDCVPVENSMYMASAYKKAGVPFSLHIFEKGWHGLSLANEEVFDSAELCASLGHVEKWLDLSFDWLKMRGFEVSTIE